MMNTNTPAATSSSSSASLSVSGIALPQQATTAGAPQHPLPSSLQPHPLSYSATSSSQNQAPLMEYVLFHRPLLYLWGLVPPPSQTSAADPVAPNVHVNSQTARSTSIRQSLYTLLGCSKTHYNLQDIPYRPTANNTSSATATVAALATAPGASFFKCIPVDKDFAFPNLRKSPAAPAQLAPSSPTSPPPPPPSSTTAKQHSPLSPLDQSSPLYPDGLFTVQWHQKHSHRYPCLVISFFDLWERDESSTSSVNASGFVKSASQSSLNFGLQRDPLGVNTLSKEVMAMEKEKDMALVMEINERKKFLLEKGMRVAIVLIMKSNQLDDRLEDRVNFIRKSCQLDARTGLFLLPGGVDLTEWTFNFQRLLQSTTQAYFTDHIKRIKKKRGNLKRPQSSQNTIDTSKPRTLNYAGWCARYDYKTAVFTEMKGDWENAIKLYELAYQNILELFIQSVTFYVSSSSSSSGWDGLVPFSNRWQEARAFLDAISFKIQILHLFLDSPVSSLATLNKHIETLKKHIPEFNLAHPIVQAAFAATGGIGDNQGVKGRMGVIMNSLSSKAFGSLVDTFMDSDKRIFSWEFWCWTSRQYRNFAELIDIFSSRPHKPLRLPFPSPGSLASNGTTTHGLLSSFAQLTSASSSPNLVPTSQETVFGPFSATNPAMVVYHAGYYFLKSARAAEERWKVLKAIGVIKGADKVGNFTMASSSTAASNQHEIVTSSNTQSQPSVLAIPSVAALQQSPTRKTSQNNLFAMATQNSQYPSSPMSPGSPNAALLSNTSLLNSPTLASGTVASLSGPLKGSIVNYWNTSLEKESAADHGNIVIELLTKAYENFKLKGGSNAANTGIQSGASIGNSSGSGVVGVTSVTTATAGNRLTLFLASEIARCYFEIGGKWEMALKFFDRIGKTYRKENWYTVLSSVLDYTIACGTKLQEWHIVVESLVELLSDAFYEKFTSAATTSVKRTEDRREKILKRLMGIMNGRIDEAGNVVVEDDDGNAENKAVATSPSATSKHGFGSILLKAPVFIDADKMNCFVSCKVQIKQATAPSSTAIPFQITLSTSPNSPPLPLRFSKMKIQFSDPKYDYILTDQPKAGVHFTSPSLTSGSPLKTKSASAKFLSFIDISDELSTLQFNEPYSIQKTSMTTSPAGSSKNVFLSKPVDLEIRRNMTKVFEGTLSLPAITQEGSDKSAMPAVSPDLRIMSVVLILEAPAGVLALVYKISERSLEQPSSSLERRKWWIVEANSMKSVLLDGYGQISMIRALKTQPKLRLSLRHDFPAFVDEIFPVTVELVNEEKKELRAIVDIETKNTFDGTDRRCRLLMDLPLHTSLIPPNSASSIFGIDFGVVGSGQTRTKVIWIQSTDPSIGERILACNLYSRFVNGSLETISGLEYQSDAYFRKADNFRIPFVRPFEVRCEVQSINEASVAASTDGHDREHERGILELDRSKEIMVAVGIKCLGPWEVTVNRTTFEPTVQSIEEDSASAASVQIDVIRTINTMGDRQGDGLIWKPKCWYNLLVHLKLRYPVELNTAHVPVGTLSVEWKRRSQSTGNITTIDTSLSLPPLPFQNNSVRVTTHLPSLLFVGQPFTLGYEFQNPTSATKEYSVYVESSESFVFGGYKSFTLRLLPYSNRKVHQVIVPLTAGRVFLPRWKFFDGTNSSPVDLGSTGSLAPLNSGTPTSDHGLASPALSATAQSSAVTSPVGGSEVVGKDRGYWIIGKNGDLVWVGGGLHGSVGKNVDESRSVFVRPRVDF